jgi:hypothetical protein
MVAVESVGRTNKAARKLMRAAMSREAWIKDDIPDLINIARAELNRHHYELPAFDTINPLAKRIRTAVNRELGRRVMDGVGRVGQVLIDDLLQQGETGWWQRLKDPAPKATVRNLAEHLEYRAWLDGINVGLSVFQTMPLAKIQHFALMARQCDAARMREFIPSRRYAMAAALIYIRAAEAKDDVTTAEALVMLDISEGQFYKKYRKPRLLNPARWDGQKAFFWRDEVEHILAEAERTRARLTLGDLVQGMEAAQILGVRFQHFFRTLHKDLSPITVVGQRGLYYDRREVEAGISGQQP